jgi:hypothetical protein
MKNKKTKTNKHKKWLDGVVVLPTDKKGIPIWKESSFGRKR